MMMKCKFNLNPFDKFNNNYHHLSTIINTIIDISKH